MNLLQILGDSIIGGVPSNAVYDLLRFGWKKVTARPWEDLYLDAFMLAISDGQWRLTHTEVDVELTRPILHRVLHQDLALNPEDLPPTAFDNPALNHRLAQALADAGVLVFDGNPPSDEDCAQLLRRLVEQATAIFHRTIETDPNAFQKALLSQTSATHELLELTQSYLHNKFQTSLHLLTEIKDNTDALKTDVSAIRAELIAVRALLSQQQPLSVPAEGQHATVNPDILDNLSARFADVTEQRLLAMRAAWREGRKDEATDWLQDLKLDTNTWTILPAETRANLLCFEGSLELDAGNVDRAKQLLSEAQTLASPTSALRLQSLITFREEGPGAAQQILIDQGDIDSINLRAALMLEDSQVALCLSLLFTIEPNAETLRLRALAHLEGKELDQAQLAIQKAYELSPNWISIRYARAVIDYFSALSPAALPNHLLALPEPIDWMLIKRDSESKLRLQEAATTFNALAVDESENAGERQRLQIWSLACRANDDSRHEEAAEHCRSILQENPASYAAITWALARGYGIDLPQCIRTLEERTKAEPELISHQLALIICYYRLEQFSDALQALADSKPLYQENELLSTWIFWHIRLLIAMGEREAAAQLGREVDSAGHMPEVRIALLLGAAEEGNWSCVADHHWNVYQSTGDSRELLTYCEAMAEQGQWTAIADRADELVEQISTADVVRFAAISAYRAHRYDLCLKLLDDNRGHFENDELPPELRRMRIAVQRALGRLPSAMSEVEQLWREDQNIEDLLDLIALAFQSGDLKRIAVAARELRGSTEVPVDQLLQVVQVVRHTDQRLANDLWHQAYRQGIPDPLVGNVVFMGFQLGLDNSNEMRLLAQRMSELGHREEAGIFVREARDFVAFLEQQKGQWQQLSEAYLGAKIPVHVTGWSLPVLYHVNLKHNARISTPLGQTVLLARHGGKQLEAGFPDSAPQWRLNLDITALLLAAHFEILDQVENAYAPLCIPADLTQALVQMREKLIPHQPARLELQQQVVHFAESGSVHVVDPTTPMVSSLEQLVEELGPDWVALYQMAAANEGYLVDSLPLRKRDLSGLASTLPQHVERHVINVKSIIEVMWQQGYISDDEHVAAITQLGTEGQAPASTVTPLIGAKLYFDGNTIEALADANILHTAIQHFGIYLEKRYVDRLRAEQGGLVDQKAAVDWLDELLDRINAGIQSGVYEIIPSNAAIQASFDKEAVIDPGERCFITLLKCDLDENDVIWFDDRALNAYLHRDTAPIIGINEVLKALVAKGDLTPDSYYRKLHQLRTANVRFIPLQADEICHHLRKARINNGEIVETPELRTIRRYVAACLLQGNILQHPPLPENAPNQMGELAFILKLSQAISHALGEVWFQFENDEDTCRTRSEWLMSNLYLDIGGMRRMIFNDAKQDDLHMMAVDMANLLMQSIEFAPGVDDKTRRTAYYEWVYHKILRRRLDSNPELVTMTAEVVKSIFYEHIKDIDEESAEDDHKRLVKALFRLFYQELPTILKEEMDRDDDFTASLGVNYTDVVNIGDLVVEVDVFTTGASAAVNGRPAQVSLLEPSTDVVFYPQDKPSYRNGFWFEHPQTGRRIDIEGFDLALLSDSVSEREAILRQNRHWFDCTFDVFEELVASIASASNAESRYTTVRSWQAQSLEVLYRNLVSDLRTKQEFQKGSLLPSSPEGFLRHLRLSGSQSQNSFLDMLSAAAEDLIATEGLLTAILRLAGLPTPLPEPVFVAINELSELGQRQLVKQLLPELRTPIARIHAIHLLNQIRPFKPVFTRLARYIAALTLDEKGIEEFAAFAAVLRWANQELAHLSLVKGWSAPVRLAVVWSHANRLQSIFAAMNAPTSWFQEFFGSLQTQKLPVELIQHESEHWFDIVHPLRLNWSRFVLTGLCYRVDSDLSWINNDIQQRVIELTWKKIDNVEFPVTDLLLLSTLAGNVTESFLGLDIRDALERVVGVEASNRFEDIRNQALIQQIFREHLPNGTSWSYLGVLLGDFDPGLESRDMIQSATRQTNFVEIYKDKSDLGVIPLHVAARQAFHVKDQELNDYLKEQLLAVLHEVKDNTNPPRAGASIVAPSGEHLESLQLQLIEVAWRLAVANKDSQSSMTAFSNLLDSMGQILPSLLNTAGTIIQRLYEELPVSLATKFTALYLKHRVTR